MATPGDVRENRNFNNLSDEIQSAPATEIQALTLSSSKYSAVVSDWKNRRWAWKDALCRVTALSDGAKLLAVRWVDSFAHHETAFCNPSVETMAEALGKSGRSIQRAIAELQAAGWIRVDYAKGRGRTSKIVFLNGPRGEAFDTPEKVTRLAVHHADRPETVPERVTNAAEMPSERVTRLSPFSGKKVTNSVEKGDSRVTPILKPKNNQKERAQSNQTLSRPCPQLRHVAYFGSDREADWNAGLARRGYPPLSEIGVKTSDAGGVGYDIPFRYTPKADDAHGVRIARDWADWLMARHEARHDH